MKKVIYHKKDFSTHPLRGVSLRESLEDHEAHTHIRKTFVYRVACVDRMGSQNPKPEIFIVKKIKDQGKEESFRCMIKGTIYIRENRMLYEVRYAHGLWINLKWKTPVLQA